MSENHRKKFSVLLFVLVLAFAAFEGVILFTMLRAPAPMRKKFPSSSV